MAWPKGKPRPPNSGRTKGTPNKKSVEIKEFALGIVMDTVYQNNLKERALSGQLPPAIEQLLFYYAFGKPAETVKLGEDRDNPFLSAAERQQRLAELTAKADIYELDSRRRA